MLAKAAVAWVERYGNSEGAHDILAETLCEGMHHLGSSESLSDDGISGMVCITLFMSTDDTVPAIRVNCRMVTNDVGERCWPCGIYVAELAHQFASIFDGKRVLEIGSGVGIGGIGIATHASVESVTMTDYKPRILSTIEANVELNADVINVPVSSAHLNWFESSAPDAARLFRSHDLLVAADCVYDPDIVAPLVCTTGRFLHADDKPRAALFVVTVRTADTFAKIWQSASNIRVPHQNGGS